jgi:hypothetical protein
MTIYVIIRYSKAGGEWHVEGNAFVREDKAQKYVEGNPELDYNKVTLDVDCG